MEEQYTKGTRVNRKRNALKEDAKMKRLQKEQERISRPSSCRFGKNQKKQIARTNIILDEQNQTTEQEAAAQISSRRTILRRQRRKQSHRPAEKTRTCETSHLDDLEAYDTDDGFSWGTRMAQLSEQAHRERARNAAIKEEILRTKKYYERLIVIMEESLALVHQSFRKYGELSSKRVI